MTDLRKHGDAIVELLHALEADLHYLRLLVLHGENDGLNDGQKLLRLKFDHAWCTVLDDVVNERKETLSEFWKRNEIIFDHLQSRLA